MGRGISSCNPFTKKGGKVVSLYVFLAKNINQNFNFQK